jgi:hypothetical protein
MTPRPYRVDFRDTSGAWRYFSCCKTRESATRSMIGDPMYYGARIIDRRTGIVVGGYSGRSRSGWSSSGWVLAA